jgi:N6-L-threonylcarbamoyladenine synthase
MYSILNKTSFITTTTTKLISSNKLYFLSNRSIITPTSTNIPTWTVLGIESTCDDSCAGIIRYNIQDNLPGEILADVRINQFQTHAHFGGIVPTLARKRHEVDLPLVIMEALNKLPSDVKINAVAVASTPGLIASLQAGIKEAHRISKQFQIPCYYINHLHAHILSAFLHDLPQQKHQKFPFATLLVSGGHTLIMETQSSTNHTIIGTTQDDALGEAFDKVARQLSSESLQGHGGAFIEKWARQGKSRPDLKLPIPMLNVPKSNLNFSFSGLKVAALRLLVAPSATTTTSSQTMDEKWSKEDFALEFQTRAFDHICRVVNKYLIKAKVEDQIPLTSFVVCGGVASNLILRDRLRAIVTDKWNIPLIIPSPKYCVDNGVMIAHAQFEQMEMLQPQQELPQPLQQQQHQQHQQHR